MSSSSELTQVQPTNYEALVKFFLLAISRYKYIVATSVTIFAVISVVYALSIPNVYRSSSTLSIVNDKGGTSLSGMMGQLGALSSLAGINIGGSGKKDYHIEEMLKSRDFLIPFIERHQLKPSIFAASGWDRDSNKVLFDKEKYDHEKQVWVREVKAPKKPEPSNEEAYKKFRDIYKVSYDRKKNLFQISIDYVSPYQAKIWLEMLIKEFNEYSRLESVKEIKNNIYFLEKHINEAHVTELKSSLYQLLEEQLKSLMLSESKKNFSLDIIQAPFVPEDKYGPKRAVICFAITLLGFGIGVLISVLLLYRKSN